MEQTERYVPPSTPPPLAAQVNEEEIGAASDISISSTKQIRLDPCAIFGHYNLCQSDKGKGKGGKG